MFLANKFATCTAKQSPSLTPVSRFGFSTPCTNAVVGLKRSTIIINSSPEGVISGEWDATWSLATYDDILAYFNSKSLKKTVKPKTKLGDIMHKRVFTCQPMDNIDELKGSVAMKKVNALPVLNHEDVLVGVVSKADLNLDGSEVQDVMSTPPVAAKVNDTVIMAACLMIKHEVHHIPIVDDNNKCIGIVTSSDIFSALAEDNGGQEIMNIDM